MFERLWTVFQSVTQQVCHTHTHAEFSDCSFVRQHRTVLHLGQFTSSLTECCTHTQPHHTTNLRHSILRLRFSSLFRFLSSSSSSFSPVAAVLFVIVFRLFRYSHIYTLALTHVATHSHAQRQFIQLSHWDFVQFLFHLMECSLPHHIVAHGTMKDFDSRVTVLHDQILYVNKWILNWQQTNTFTHSLIHPSTPNGMPWKCCRHERCAAEANTLLKIDTFIECHPQKTEIIHCVNCCTPDDVAVDERNIWLCTVYAVRCTLYRMKSVACREAISHNFTSCQTIQFQFTSGRTEDNFRAGWTQGTDIGHGPPRMRVWEQNYHFRRRPSVLILQNVPAIVVIVTVVLHVLLCFFYCCNRCVASSVSTQLLSIHENGFGHFCSCYTLRVSTICFYRLPLRLGFNVNSWMQFSFNWMSTPLRSPNWTGE